MPRKLIRAALAAAAVVVLAGCTRFSSSYTIQSDDTVDGSIFVAAKEGYQTDGDPYFGTGAGDIAANFTSATITEDMVFGWYGYYIDFTNEPLATFAWAPDEPWKLQITKSGSVYTVLGFNGEYTADNVTQIQTEDGYMTLSVSFPGALTEQFGAVASGTTDGGQGWVYWDLLAIESGGSGQAYAKGNGSFTLIPIDPGIFDSLFPDPATLPAEPAPAVTVTLPAPAPIVTPVATPEPSVAPSVVATPDDGESSSDKASIPVWVWAVGAALVAALVGLIGYTVASRKSKAATAASLPAAPAGPAKDATRE